MAKFKGPEFLQSLFKLNSSALYGGRGIWLFGRSKCLRHFDISGFCNSNGHHRRRIRHHIRHHGGLFHGRSTSYPHLSQTVFAWSSRRRGKYPEWSLSRLRTRGLLRWNPAVTRQKVWQRISFSFCLPPNSCFETACVFLTGILSHRIVTKM